MSFEGKPLSTKVDELVQLLKMAFEPFSTMLHILGNRLTFGGWVKLFFMDKNGQICKTVFALVMTPSPFSMTGKNHLF